MTHSARPLAPDPKQDVLRGILSGVIHDLNGAAASIHGLLGLVEDDKGRLEPDLLGMLHHEVHRISSATNDLSALAVPSSRPEEAVQLKDLVSEIVRLLERDPNLARVDKTCRLADDLPEVLVKRAEIADALLLLGARLCAATTPRGHVTFESHRDDDSIRITLGSSSLLDSEWTREIRSIVQLKVESNGGALDLRADGADLVLPIPRFEP